MARRDFNAMAEHSEFSDLTRRGLLDSLLSPVTGVVKDTVGGVTKTVGNVVDKVVDTVDNVVTVVDKVVDKVVPIPTKPVSLPPVSLPPVSLPPVQLPPTPQPTPDPPVNQQPPPVQQPPPQQPPSGGNSPPPQQQQPPVEQAPPPTTQQPSPPPPGNEQQPPANTPPPSAATPPAQPTSNGKDATETPLPPKQSNPIAGAGINIAANAPTNGNGQSDPNAPGTGSNPAGMPTRLQQDASTSGQTPGSSTNSGANTNGAPGSGVDGKSGNGIITPGGNGNGNGANNGSGSQPGIDAGSSGSNGPNVGAIAGGIIGALIALLIIFALLFRYRRSRRLRGMMGFFNRRDMRKHKRSSSPNGMMGASLLEKGNMYDDVDREMWCPSPPPFEDGKRLSTDNGAAPQEPRPARHKPLPVQYNTFAAAATTTTPALTGAVISKSQQAPSMSEKRSSDSSLQAAILAVNGYKPDSGFKHPATQHPTKLASKKPPALHPTSSTIGLSFGGPATPALPSPARSRPSNDAGRDMRQSQSGWSDYFRYHQHERPTSIDSVSGVSIASSGCMSPSMMSWQPNGSGAPPTAHSSLFTQSRPPTGSKP